MICGSEGSKRRLTTATGVEPSGQMRDEQLHTVVARSTFPSQKCRKLMGTEHFWTLVQMSFFVGGAWGCASCQKSAKCEVFVPASLQPLRHYVPAHYNYQLLIDNHVYNCNYHYLMLHCTTPITLQYYTPRRST